MNQNKNGLERLYNCKKNLEFLLKKAEERELNEEEKTLIKEVDKFKDSFVSSMEDDINTADAVSALFELTKFANSKLNDFISKNLIEYTYNTMIELAKVLGILSKNDEMLEDEINELIEKRTEARKNKNFKLADEIRDNLKEKGIILEDTTSGVKWKRIWIWKI